MEEAPTPSAGVTLLPLTLLLPLEEEELEVEEEPPPVTGMMVETTLHTAQPPNPAQPPPAAALSEPLISAHVSRATNEEPASSDARTNSILHAWLL